MGFQGWCERLYTGRGRVSPSIYDGVAGSGKFKFPSDRTTAADLQDAVGRIGGDKFELVSSLGQGAFYGSRRQFEDGMRGEAGGQAPGANMTANFFHFLVAVEINKVQRELHKKSVDGFAGYDPHAPSGWEAGAPEQSLIAGCGRVGRLGAASELGLASEVLDLEAGSGIRRVVPMRPFQSIYLLLSSYSLRGCHTQSLIQGLHW